MTALVSEPQSKTAIACRIDSITVGNRLRALDEAKVLAFMDSIRRDGLRTPITVFGWGCDGTRRLSAGGHRLEACRRLGMETILCFQETGDDYDCELWEIDENLIRSDLTPSDRALFTHRRKEIYLLKFPQTEHGGDRRSSRQVGDLKSDGGKRFTAATAQTTGQTERTIQRDAERGARISAAALQMLRGTRHDKGVTLDQLKRLDTPESQERFARDLLAADRAVTAESKVIRTTKMQRHRDGRMNLIAAIAENGKRVAGKMPRNAYPVGYVDVPWEQEAWSDETGQDRGLMYPAMELEEIKALCAGDKSPFTKDAVLFFWVTTNRMADGIEVMRAWGFEYVSAITWDKVDIGMGRWVRDRTEHLLIGKRGSISMAPLEGTQSPSLYSEKKSGHSIKPVWFAEMIDRLWPGLPKLELFNRRDRLVVGDVRLTGKWDFWGFEADGEPQPAPEAGFAANASFSEMPCAPAHGESISIAIGDMGKASASISIKRDVEGPFLISMEYEFPGFSGGCSPFGGSFSSYEAALTRALTLVQGRLEEVRHSEGSVTPSGARASATSGSDWIDRQAMAWGLI